MGQPVVHWELWSKDPAKVSDFYARVFEWKIQDIPELQYRLVETGGSGGINGGIMTPAAEGALARHGLLHRRGRPRRVPQEDRRRRRQDPHRGA